MADKKPLARKIFSALLIGGSILGLINVMGDNSEVREAAKRLACQSEDCHQFREGRYPFWQTFGFSPKSGSVDVTCVRAAYLVGEWRCTKD
jgi:hypothetical protein